jgi:MFS family permease
MVRIMPGYRSLAGNRDFTALWIGQTISELGSQVSMFVFPLIAWAMTGSALIAALAEALHLLGLAATLLPAGVLADRVHRRRLMRASSGTGILLYSSLAVAGSQGVLTLPHLLVVALLTGAAAGLFAPAEISALRSVVSEEDLPTALSQNQARRHIATLVGGPLGGALYGLIRWLPFAADAISFALSWMLLGRIRTDLSAPERTGPRRRPRQDIADGLRFIWNNPLFRVLTCWSALTNLVVNALFVVAVLRLIQGGFAPWQIGLVETAAGTCGILGAIVAPWLIERFSTGRLTVVIAWSFLPLLLPLVLWNNPAVVAAALSFGLFLNPAGNAGIQAYRIAVTPGDLIGRVQSTTQFVAMSAMPLAPVIGGALLAGLGGPAAMVILGLLTAGVALIPTLSRTVRSVPRRAVWREQRTADRHAVQGY